jgi:hypothetical protein
MSTALDLAGTIGTWVAVCLSFIALAGVLPAYLLYRRSKTTESQALALVDDPSNRFVTSRRLFPGLYLKHRCKIPDLRAPPCLKLLDSVRRDDYKQLVGRESATCWVNFVRIIETVFPSITNNISSDILDFRDQQSYLPVNCLWVLLLGVVHRYAIRLHRGLSLGAMFQSSTYEHATFDLVSGTSGMLTTRIPKCMDPSPVERLFFEAHSYSVANQAMRSELIPLQALVYLVLGYVPCEQGEFFYMGKRQTRHVSRRRYTRATHVSIDRVTNGSIAELETSELERQDEEIMRRIGLKVPKVASLLLASRSVYQEPASVLLADAGYHEIGSLYDVRNVWMKEQLVQHIVMNYLRVKTSPQGMLHDISRDEFVIRVLDARDFMHTLELTQQVIPCLTCSAHDRLRLQASLDSVVALDWKPEEATWSRSAMQATYALDQALEAVRTPNDHLWEAVSILYSYKMEFRKELA